MGHRRSPTRQEFGMQVVQIESIHQQPAAGGGSSPISKSTVVLLPLPVLPISPIRSPRRISKSSPRNTSGCSGPYWKCKPSRRMLSEAALEEPPEPGEAEAGLALPELPELRRCSFSTKPSCCTSVAGQAASVEPGQGTHERNDVSVAASLPHQSPKQGDRHHAQSLERIAWKGSKKTIFGLKLVLGAVRLAVDLNVRGWLPSRSTSRMAPRPSCNALSC